MSAPRGPGALERFNRGKRIGGTPRRARNCPRAEPSVIDGSTPALSSHHEYHGGHHSIHARQREQREHRVGHLRFGLVRPRRNRSEAGTTDDGGRERARDQEREIPTFDARTVESCPRKQALMALCETHDRCMYYGISLKTRWGGTTRQVAGTRCRDR